MSPRASILAGLFITLTLGSGAGAQDNPLVVLETSLGDITVELFEDKAPISVENFLVYVNNDFYADTVFHRVIRTFMIQGGGMTAALTEKRTRAPIKNEATNGMSNERGTIAMARTNAADSATSQFFINTTDNGGRGLDHRGTDPQSYGYAVFGRVIEGMDVVDAIAAVPTTRRGPHENVPVEPVLIHTVAVP